MKKIGSYCFLICILCSVVFLLGVSYSKDSGGGIDAVSKYNLVDNLAINYSSNNINNENKESIISIVNHNEEEIDYVLVLNGDCDSNANVLINGVSYNYNKDIYKGHLSKYGTKGDQETIDVVVESDKDFDLNVYVSLKDEDTIYDMIVNDSNVVKDDKGNYRYQGESVNNYIVYNNETYQIIGVIDGKVKVISSIVGLGVRNSEHEYATVEDYLGTYKEDNVNAKNILNYSSWINDKGFWLADNEGNLGYYGSKVNGIGTGSIYTSYYLRYVYYLDKDLVYKDGDGSITSPYEVVYDS